MRKRIVPLLLLFSLLLGGCAPSTAERSVTFFAMDTYMTLRVFDGDDALLDDAEEVVTDMERRISVTDEGSEIAHLNRVGKSKLSLDTRALLKRALALCEETAGALDITVYPLVRAWGFTTNRQHVPEEETIRSLLPAVGYRGVTWDGDAAVLPAGAEIDLGAVAKGYLGERLAVLLRMRGVSSALLDLGGNIQTVGKKPDGTPWHIAVRAPQGDGNLGVVDVEDEAVVTSGGYERFFTGEDGTVYWHILDPATGYPARSGVISATVVGKDGARCDALATALFVLGAERATAFWRQHKDFEMLLLTEDGELLVTPQLSERFTPNGDAGYRLQVIDRVKD